ncbi:MAG: C10 family peptidase [Bacteroidales bacterium]|nr:C10 family peptidase [Bacteroidales bacterium]
MKNRLIFLLFGVLLTTLTACHEVRVDMKPEMNDLNSILLESKVIGNATFSVSFEDAEYLASLFKGHGEIKEIIPINFNKETLLYVVNYANGWVIISGDKRACPIIAENECGSFEKGKIPDGVIDWLGSECEYIYSLRVSTEIKDNEYSRLWDSFPKPIRGQAQTKSDPDMKWCVITESVSVKDTVIMVVPHLLSTKWGQDYPWNIKLPLDLQVSRKCYIGCTAVAVGQMLYYCHNSIGKPSGLYHNINCSASSVNGSSTNIGFSRSNYVANSSRWQDMALWCNDYNTDYAGDLMIDVGNRLNMAYSGSGSGAFITTQGLSYYDLSYSEADYSSTIVRSQLHANKPIIVTAYNTTYTTGVWPFTKTNYTDGHTWIIDGIAQNRRIWTYTKHAEYTENWRNESEVYNSLSEILSKYHIQDINESFEDDEVTSVDYLLMNWGYDGSYDSGLYSMNPNDAWYANGGNHSYLRTIYYDFH